MVSYECSVCLENLDQPASIDLENNGEGGEQEIDPIAEAQRMLLFEEGAARRGGGRGRGRGRLSQVNVPAPAGIQRGAAANPMNLTDVVATHCGHLYHQVCLEKWFTEQGRRTCPSCRKSIAKSKCIRLYPNISQDLGGRGSQHNENAAPAPPQVPSVVVAGSSGVASGSNSTNISPGTSGGVSSANEGGGGGGEGAFCNNIGGGEDGAGGGGGDGGAEDGAEGGGGNVGAEGGGGNVGADCRKAECQDLKVIHNTLMNDFNELQERFNDLRENDELKEATIRSLEDDNELKGNEIDRLQRQLQEEESSGRSAAVSSSSSSAPRRRRR